MVERKLTKIVNGFRETTAKRDIDDRQRIRNNDTMQRCTNGKKWRILKEDDVDGGAYETVNKKYDEGKSGGQVR